MRSSSTGVVEWFGATFKAHLGKAAWLINKCHYRESIAQGTHAVESVVRKNFSGESTRYAAQEWPDSATGWSIHYCHRAIQATVPCRG